jgi:hypothetical protein
MLGPNAVSNRLATHRMLIFEEWSCIGIKIAMRNLKKINFFATEIVDRLVNVAQLMMIGQ